MIRIYRCAGKRLSYKMVFSPGEEGCSERTHSEASGRLAVSFFLTWLTNICSVNFSECVLHNKKVKTSMYRSSFLLV